LPVAQGTYIIYRVQPNDTLYSISLALGSTVNQIEQLNALFPPFTDPGLIFPGQVLIVPNLYMQTFDTLYSVSEGDALYLIADRFATNIGTLLRLNPQITDPNLILENELIRIPARIYTVAAGDTLNRIGRRTGVPISRIINANRGRAGFSPDVLFPGYGLVLPMGM